MKGAGLRELRFQAFRAVYVHYFERRPKYPTDMTVTMKVNAEVLDDAARLRTSGDPNFCRHA